MCIVASIRRLFTIRTSDFHLPLTPLSLSCSHPLPRAAIDTTPSGNVGPGVLLEVLVLAYCFLGLGIVCDNHLCPALETLCVRWMIPEDVVRLFWSLHTHTHTHARTHARTHTHAHTHARTHNLCTLLLPSGTWLDARSVSRQHLLARAGWTDSTHSYCCSLFLLTRKHAFSNSNDGSARACACAYFKGWCHLHGAWLCSTRDRD